MAVSIYAGNDNLFQLLGLTDISTGAFVNNATVNVTVKKVSDGSTLGTASMPYVTGTNGNYQGTLLAASAPTAQVGYTAQIVVTTPSGGTAEWDIPVFGATRNDPNF
jgi:hypothetical protein